MKSENEPVCCNNINFGNAGTKKHDNNQLSKIVSKQVNIDHESFKKDEKFDKILIMKKDDEYFALGRIYIKSIPKQTRINKLKLDIELKHPCLPLFFGFDSSIDGQEVFEIRKINFKPHPLTKQALSGAPRLQLLKMITQMIDFINYISNTKHSVSLMTIDDIFSSCFLDGDFNIYFGDLSFIDIDFCIQKSIVSLGHVASIIFGCEININKYNRYVYDETIPFFWRNYISTCLSGKFDLSSFYSPFMRRNRRNISDMFLYDKSIGNEIEMKEYELKENTFILEFNDDYLMKRNKNLKCEYIEVDDKETFIKEKAGKTIYIERIGPEKLAIEIEFVDSMILPFKGFSFADKTNDEIHIYRESDQELSLIDCRYEKLRELSDLSKIQLTKDFLSFIRFLTEETHYQININDFYKSIALKKNERIVFVNLCFIEQSTCIDEQKKTNIESFWSIFDLIWNNKKPLNVDLPTVIQKIFKKEGSKNINDFGKLLNFWKDFDPKVNQIEKLVFKYLKDYFIDDEIEGHQCHVTIYKRSLISNKKFKRLVLKKYNFEFSDNLKRKIKKMRKIEGNDIIETWTTENSSYVLMKYVKAQRLKDLIPDLNYDQMIKVLKKITLLISKNNTKIFFCSLSTDNIYLDTNDEIKLLDSVFVSDDSDDQFLPPEAAHLSTIKDYEKEKIDVYSIGIIAYEMFGGVYDPSKDFNFENIPLFIQYFVRVCCFKNCFDRAGIYSILEKLDKYEEPYVEKLFQVDLIEISPYYIDKDDLIDPSFMNSFGSKIQKCTKKLLTKSPLVLSFYENGSDMMKFLILSSQCRHAIPVYGFSIDDYYYYYYEFSRELSFITDVSYDIEFKLDLLTKLSQFNSDIYDLGAINYSHYTLMLIDHEKKAKFTHGFLMHFFHGMNMIEQHIMALDKFYEIICELFNKGEINKKFEPDTPLIVQAFVWKIIFGEFEERATFKRIAKVFEGRSLSLISTKEQEEGSEILLYKSNKNTDLVEEGIRVEILMESSNLFSYSRNENDFILYYNGTCDLNFLNKLRNLENYSVKDFREKERLKNFKVDHEYKGKHCLVQFLVNGEEKLVLKKYYKKYCDTVPRSYDWRISSDVWEEDGKLMITQKYYDIETFEELIKRKDGFIDEVFIKEFVSENLSHHKYHKTSPHNLCVEKGKNKSKILIVDTIDLDHNNYLDFIDDFSAPECFKYSELNKEDLKSTVVYSTGWTAYALFGLTPEFDSDSKRFKPPSFPDGFPKFWKDFITVATRENSIDRPEIKYLYNKINDSSPFEDFDLIVVSSKLLSHDDFEFKNPIGAGGEAVIYLAISKTTGEKQACKKLKYKKKSVEVKKMLLAIDQLDSSIFGIKYIGISIHDDDDVFLHMQYVPNGSLSEIISLDRRMKAPSWFTESAKFRISKEIAEGMKSLHNQGFVHKDLKPENILFDENNSVKICDFSFIPEDETATLMYMAPELLNGESASYKSDVYSFAVTLTALYGGGDMNTSISINTPSLIQNIIKKCLNHNPDERPTFTEIVDELSHSNNEIAYDHKIESMDEFPNFDPSISHGVLTDDYEYEICDITGNADDSEHYIHLYMAIQPDNILHIEKYCRLGDKIVLIIERCVDKTTFDLYLGEKKVSQSRGEKFISDFISLFELYHKNKFHFGPFSLKRLFFRDRHRSSICFDIFMIPGLTRAMNNYDVLVAPPEGFYSMDADSYSFACFVLRIFNCLSFDEDRNVSRKPFKRSSKASRQQIPYKYQNIIMERCLSKEPMTRPTFGLLFQKLFPVQYKIISTFLSVSVSRFSTFNMKNDLKHEEIITLETLGSGTFGKVYHALNKSNNQDLAVKEFNDSIGEKNEDFMLEYVALKAIDHPNIIKIYGATQRKESVHGSQLFMEFANGGDLEKNMNEPFELFIIHLLQVSSAMKYLHQRGIIHFDLKPKNILIRGDGSAVVADFNTAMHVDIDTHLRNQRGSENYMSPEIKKGEKYSFTTDVYSFGVMAAEYFSPNAHRIIEEANMKYEHPVLEFIPHKDLRALLEFCVDDDPMSRPSFEFICNYIFGKYIKDTPRASELEELIRIPRIDEDKLNQLRVLASRGSSEATNEYGKYLLCENLFNDAMLVFKSGADNNDLSCQNTLGVLSITNLADCLIEKDNTSIIDAAYADEKLGMTNLGVVLIRAKEICDELYGFLWRAYSSGVSFAGYLLGYACEQFDIPGPTVNKRMKDAIELYHDAAKEGDPFAQYKYGICLEEGFTTDDDGFDCVHYFRQSAYQRYWYGCSKYAEYLDGERKEYYESLCELLPKGKTRFLWNDEQIFYDEMVSCITGIHLSDSASKERHNFLLKKMFEKLYS